MNEYLSQLPCENFVEATIIQKARGIVDEEMICLT